MALNEQPSRAAHERRMQRLAESRALVALAFPSDMGRAVAQSDRLVTTSQGLLAPSTEASLASQALQSARGAIVAEELQPHLQGAATAAERIAQAQTDLHVDPRIIQVTEIVRGVLRHEMIVIDPARMNAIPTDLEIQTDGRPAIRYHAAATRDLLVVDAARAIIGAQDATVTIANVTHQRNPSVGAEPLTTRQRDQITRELKQRLEPIAQQMGFETVDALLTHAAGQIGVTAENLGVLNAIHHAEQRIQAIHDTTSHLLVNSTYRRAHEGGNTIIDRLSYAHPSRQAYVARELALAGTPITLPELQARIAADGQYRTDVNVTNLRVAQMVSSLARTFGVPEAPANATTATGRYVNFITQAQADIAQMPAAMDAYFADATLQEETLIARAAQFRIPTEGRNDADIRQDLQRVQDVIWLSLAEQLQVASVIGSVDPSATRSLVIAYLTNEVAQDLALSPETQRVMELAERTLAVEQLHIYARRTILPTVDVEISPFRQDGTRVSEPAAQEYLDYHPIHRRRAKRNGAIPPLQ